jgi:hypothetical protein
LVAQLEAAIDGGKFDYIVFDRHALVSCTPGTVPQYYKLFQIIAPTKC